MLFEKLRRLFFQAHVFENSLYKTDWQGMEKGNKQILLLLMMGSQRKVNIRAGGTYELNLALFAQVGHITVR